MPQMILKNGMSDQFKVTLIDPATGLEYQQEIHSQFNLDMGARTRTSQLTTLGDLKCLNADCSLLLENTGTGTGSYANSIYTMSVTSGQYLIRRSRQYYPYFSGKTQLIEITCDNFQTQANIIKRIGYFSSNAAAPYDTNKDGVWIEDDGTTKYLVVSNFGTETLRLPITSWTGYNNISSYNWSMFTVIAIDFLWLGGAALRLSLRTDKGFIEAHVFHYAGTSQGVFMRSPNQCVRYEIRSTTGTGTLRAICAQVSTEGSIVESGKQRSVDTGHVAIVLNTIGIAYPTIAIRKKAGYRDSSLKAIGFNTFVSSGTDILKVQLVLNPTFSAPFTYTALTDSSVEFGIGNGAITCTGGTVLRSLYLTQNSIIPSGLLDDDYLSVLGSNISDISDILAIVCTPVTATISIFSGISFKEY